MNESSKFIIEVINALAALAAVSGFARWLYKRGKPLFSKASSGERKAKRVEIFYMRKAEVASDASLLAIRLAYRIAASTVVCGMGVAMIVAGLYDVTVEPGRAPADVNADTVRALAFFFAMAAILGIGGYLEVQGWYSAIRDPEGTHEKAASRIRQALEEADVDSTDIAARIAKLPRIPGLVPRTTPPGEGALLPTA